MNNLRVGDVVWYKGAAWQLVEGENSYIDGDGYFDGYVYFERFNDVTGAMEKCKEYISNLYDLVILAKNTARLSTY